MADYYPGETPQYQAPNLPYIDTTQAQANVSGILKNTSDTLDSIFNNQIKQKLANQEIQKNQIQLGQARMAYAPFGFTPEQVTPQSVQQAAAPPILAPEPGQGQGMFANPGQDIDPQNIQGMRAYMAMQQRMAAQGFQQQQAQTGLTQAEAAQKQAEAGLSQAQIDMLGGNGSVSKLFADRIQNGDMTIGDLSATGRGEIGNALKVSTMAELAKRGVNVNALNNAAAARQEKATSTASIQGGVAQKLGSAAGTLEDILNQARPLVRQLAPTDIQAVNDAWQKGQKSIKGNPAATQLLTYMGEARGKYKQVLAMGNAPGQSEDDTAKESIGRGLSPDSYDAMTEAVNFVANSTVKRLQGKGFGEKSQTTNNPLIPQAKPITRYIGGKPVQVIPLGNGKFQQVP